MPILTERALETPVGLGRFCLMTYDVQSCIGLDSRVSPFRVIAVISRHRPDVVCLQELDSNCERTGRVNQAAIVAERLRMSYESFPIFYDRGEESHIAVFSRFPMSRMKAGYLPPESRRPGRRLAAALWTEIALPSKRIEVINVNLSRDAHEQQPEVRRLLGSEWLEAASRRGPVIVCGELNAPPGSAAYGELASRLQDVQSSLPSRAVNTWPNPYPFRRTDYIFTTSELGVEDALTPQSRLEKSASDHLPVVVQIKVP